MTAFLQKRDLLRVRLALFTGALLLVTTGPLQAQTRELWRTGLTNLCSFCGARTNYTTTSAVVDGKGQTIVGGLIEWVSSPSGIFQERAFVAEFGSEGQRLWDFE